MLKTLRLLVSEALFASARLVLQGVSTGAVAPSVRAHREEEEEEEVTSVQPRGHDEMSTKHTETETTTDHKRWPNEGEK
jgi:hypothetical protein